jgi:hypothetical protein
MPFLRGVDAWGDSWDHRQHGSAGWSPENPTMPRSVELPDELADVLTDEASRLGLSLPEYAVRLLASVPSAHPATTSVRTGADLVGFWQVQNLIGTRPDIADSQAQARCLREQAQHRAR